MKNKRALSLCLLLVCGFISAMRKKSIPNKEAYQKGTNVNVVEQNLKIAISKKDNGKVQEFIQGLKDWYTKNGKSSDRALYHIKQAGVTGEQAQRLFDGESINDVLGVRRPIVTTGPDIQIPGREEIINDEVTEQPSPLPIIPSPLPNQQQPQQPQQQQPTTPVDIEDIDELYIEPQPQPQQGQQQQQQGQQPPIVNQPEPVIVPQPQPQQGQQLTALQQAFAQANNGQIQALWDYVNDPAHESELAAIKLEFEKQENANAKRDAVDVYNGILEALA